MKIGSLAIAILYVAPFCSYAQTMPSVSSLDGYTPGQVQQGGPFGSLTLSNFEVYNPGSGEITINIPLFTVKGRGQVAVPIGVSPTPPTWDVTANSYISGCPSCTVNWSYSMSGTGWGNVLGYGAGQMAFRSSGDYCVVGSGGAEQWNNTLTRATFTAPDGTETEFVDQKTNGTPEPGSTSYNRGTVFIADNGTMALFTSSAPVTDSASCASGESLLASGTLLFRDGTRYTLSNGSVTQIEDSNGNITTFGSTITDSLGRTYKITYANANNNYAYDQIQYSGEGGATRTITIRYASLASLLASGESVQTYGNLWSISLSNGNQQFNPTGLISEIDLPDGTKYSFTYHSYGDVAQVTLPMGGVIEYSYNENTNWATTGSGTIYYQPFNENVTVPAASTFSLSRPLQSRKQLLNGAVISEMDFVGGNEIDWKDGSGNILAKQTYTIASSGTLASSGTNYNPPQYDETTSVTYYDASGNTVLKSQSIDYVEPLNCKTNCSTAQKVTTYKNGMVTQTGYTYDQNNNVTDEKDYDWGTGNPGGLLREVKTTYSPYSSSSVNILGLVSNVQVLDGAGKLYSHATYSYDQYTAPQTPIYNCGNVSGHDNTNYAGGTGLGATRGNLTQISQWLNTNSSWLNTYQSYSMCGNLMQIQDANGNTTSFSYNDNFSDGNDSRNTYGFLTAVTNALRQLSFQANYD